MNYSSNHFIGVLDSASELDIVYKSNSGGYYINPTLKSDKKSKSEQLIELFEKELDVTAEIKEELYVDWLRKKLYVYYDHDVQIGDFVGRAYRIWL